MFIVTRRRSDKSIRYYTCGAGWSTNPDKAKRFATREEAKRRKGHGKNDQIIPQKQQQIHER